MAAGPGGLPGAEIETSPISGRRKEKIEKRSDDFSFSLREHLLFTLFSFLSSGARRCRRSRGGARGRGSTSYSLSSSLKSFRYRITSRSRDHLLQNPGAPRGRKSAVPCGWLPSDEPWPHPAAIARRRTGPAGKRPCGLSDAVPNRLQKMALSPILFLALIQEHGQTVMSPPFLGTHFNCPFEKSLGLVLHAQMHMHGGRVVERAEGLCAQVQGSAVGLNGLPMLSLEA